jgi:hypothetical protein
MGGLEVEMGPIKFDPLAFFRCSAIAGLEVETGSTRPNVVVEMGLIYSSVVFGTGVCGMLVVNRVSSSGSLSVSSSGSSSSSGSGSVNSGAIVVAVDRSRTRR